jgi:transaldolase
VASKWVELEQHGQSIWYDNVARPALESGLLERLMADDGVSGGTSNPSIFAAAVTGSDLYDDDIRNAGADESAQQVFERCAVADIQRACDLMRPVWDRTGGDDGYISLEVEADLAFEQDATVQRAHRLRALVDRPNVMIKVPGTAEGVEAFRRLTREGVSVNVTLLFSTERYREIADAYVDAIEGRVDAGEPVGDIASVASFFVSRIDTQVDKQLPEGSPLRGRAAVDNAKLAYVDVFEQVFQGPRWERLAAAGARVQRPLWASTSTKNPAYAPTLYVDTLIAEHTVNTVPDATLDAYRTHGDPRADTIHEGVDEARKTMAGLADAGVDFAQVTRELEDEGVKAFADAYDGMLKAIQEKREAIGVS